MFFFTSTVRVVFPAPPFCVEIATYLVSFILLIIIIVIHKSDYGSVLLITRTYIRFHSHSWLHPLVWLQVRPLFQVFKQITSSACQWLWRRIWASLNGPSFLCKTSPVYSLSRAPVFSPSSESRCKSIGIFSYPYHSRNEWQRVAQGGSGWHRKNAGSEAEMAVILHPSDRACPWNTTTGLSGNTPIRPMADFYWH